MLHVVQYMLCYCYYFLLLTISLFSAVDEYEYSKQLSMKIRIVGGR